MIASLDECQLSALLRGIDIPACPAILVELDAELHKKLPDQGAIVRLISRDVALSGRVMQVANSPALAAGSQVDSVMQALTLLGGHQIFNLVVAQLLKLALVSGPQGQLDRFWDGSAAAAELAAEIARRLHCVEPEKAYTFSLLHDCGIPLLMKRFDDYRWVLGEANLAADKQFTDIENAYLHTSHAVVGYFLARRWNLPEFVAQGILLHHNYEILEEAGRVPAEARTVIAINVLAEHVIRKHARLGKEAEWYKAAGRVRRFFGLSGGDVRDLVEDMLDWMEAREHAA